MVSSDSIYNLTLGELLPYVLGAVIIIIIQLVYKFFRRENNYPGQQSIHAGGDYVTGGRDVQNAGGNIGDNIRAGQIIRNEGAKVGRQSNIQGNRNNISHQVDQSKIHVEDAAVGVIGGGKVKIGGGMKINK